MQLRAAAAMGYRKLCEHVLNPLLGKHCPVCGNKAVMRSRDCLDERLIRDWKLSPKWVEAFNQREFTFCQMCEAKVRDQHFATALTRLINQACDSKATTLSNAIEVERFQTVRIAEINSVGLLHQTISRHSNLVYSEFGSADPAIPHQDLLHLTYEDHSFDYVLTSETLEHIPDFELAMKEIFRVLKRGGAHVFTIPVVWDRQCTVQRARIDNGTVQYLESPSYHGGYSLAAADYLVFYEFGADVRDRIEAIGYELTVEFDARNPALAVLIARKP